MNKEWQTKRLGDVVSRLTNGYVGPTRNIYHDTGVPYLLARHVKSNVLQFDGRTFISDEFNQKNKKSILKAGDVLLVQSGHIGHSAVVTKEHEGHNCHAMIVISPIKDAVTGPFLSLFFNTPNMQRSFEEIRSGSTVPHLTCRAVKELQIPVPPLAEQQRIVGLMDEAFAGLVTAKANAEKNLQNARALFESHLQSVFTQRRKGWKPTKLGEEIDLLAGFAFKSAQYTTKEKDVRLLRGDNIIQSCLRWHDVKRWPANDTKEYERYQLREGDVVLAMDRPWVNAGLKHATIAAEDLPCLLVQRTARLRG